MSSVPIIPCLNFVVILMGPYQVWTNLPKLQVCYHSFFSWRNKLFVYSQAAKETSQICNFSWNFHFVCFPFSSKNFFKKLIYLISRVFSWPWFLHHFIREINSLFIFLGEEEEDLEDDINGIWSASQLAAKEKNIITQNSTTPKSSQVS